jgi:pilus assembly protein CpaE
MKEATVQLGSPSSRERRSPRAAQRSSSSRSSSRSRSRSQKEDHSPAPRRRIEGKGRHTRFATRVFEGKATPTPTPTPSASGHTASDVGQQGSVTLFLSCTGGAGATTIASTVAAMLARAGKQVCLLDLDFQFGGALTALNLTNRYPLSTIMADLTTNAKQRPDRRLTSEQLLARLPRHADTGLHVVSQVGHVDGVSQIDPKIFTRLLRGLRRVFDHVIIDGVRDFNDFALSAMDMSDNIVMVATQDVPSLRGLVMRLELLGRLSFDQAAVHVVLNRFSRRGPVPPTTIESVGITPSFTVANDFKAVHGALGDGETLFDACPRSKVTQDIQIMARHLYGEELDSRNESRGFWRRLVRRK